MSMGYRGKSTNATREATAVQAQAENEANWGEMTGAIVSFDPATQTAQIQPDYHPMHNGSPVSMPALVDVPVRFPRSGGFVFTMPVLPGDKVTLRPQMRSSEGFHTGGTYSSPQDARSFSLSDMEAFIDGGEPITSPIPSFNNSNLEIRTIDGSFKLQMTPDGKFSIENVNGELIDMLAEIAELLASDGLEIQYGSSSGSGHQLENKGQYAAIGAKLRGIIAT